LATYASNLLENMIKNILSLSLFLTGNNIVEFQKVYSYSLTKKTVNNKSYLSVSGNVFDSTYCVEKIYQKPLESEINILVFITPDCRNRSNSFRTEVEVTSSLERVTFGKNRYSLWDNKKS
jgi:hypothetical protein